MFKPDAGGDMIKGERVTLRLIRDDDWPLLEAWVEDPNAAWGPFQRFQLDRVRILKEAYEKTGLFSRGSGVLIVEAADAGKPVGVVRYTFHPLADRDMPTPEIGFVIADASAWGKGYAKEAVALLTSYIFLRFPAQRLSAFTDIENTPPAGMGLGIMRDRAREIDATLRITSQPGQGTEVLVAWQESG
jgi:RimJ/RimL family protein N-acetyltransferase